MSTSHAEHLVLVRLSKKFDEVTAVADVSVEASSYGDLKQRFLVGDEVMVSWIRTMPWYLARMDL